MAPTFKAKPILVIDGSHFSDFEGFAREFSTLLADWTWHASLDAFNDILRGGFGTPQGGFVLRWLNAGRSRDALGDRFALVIEIIRDHGPGGREAEDGVELELL
jgi:RNAse (barnase) inhibitor barstar